MNENKLKVFIGTRSKSKKLLKYQSFQVKPSGKFWKRHFDKKVRKDAIRKKCNWWYWS